MPICSRAITGHIALLNQRAVSRTTGARKAAFSLICLLLLSGYVSIARGQTPTPGCADSWAATSTANAPAGRVSHTAVWTGSEMIVWGGSDGNGQLNTGGKFNPATDSWTIVNATNAPSVRSRHTAVWTGSEMIVWGGSNGGSTTNTGGRYDPTTDSWSAINTTNAPSARGGHTAVWTGSEMIVWGGQDASGNYQNTGARYNPITDSWVATSTTGAASRRWFHTAVWTGSEMIVWGGSDGIPLNTGGRYNPSMDSWIATGISGAPSLRTGHTAVWTGSEMIIWGGLTDIPGMYFNDGARYNPSIGNWVATNSAGAPEGRSNHTAVWTGSEMIVWGGFNGSGRLSSGGRYNPSANGWVATGSSGAPAARSGHTAVWTGSAMIVWAGFSVDGGGQYANTGGRYCAQPSVTPTPTVPPVVNVSGTLQYCSNPVPGPVPNALLTLTGTAAGSTLSDGSGNYQFASLPFGGSYTITPSKSARPPGSIGVTTVDVIATQRHFLVISLLTGCRLTAADVNGDVSVNTVDVIAIQRFFLGLSSGIANVGKYQFAPASRSYSVITSDQTGQNYDTLVFGDVASPFVE